jgi:hypothetical protein
MKQEIKLEDIFNDEKKQGVKDMIDMSKYTIGCDPYDKQETLEDASWKYNPLKKLDGEFLRHAFKEGAKWQAERMYNKEKVDKLLDALLYNNMCSVAGDELIEQFKNK